jgi:Ca2+-binding EF-hand superfamily protein
MNINKGSSFKQDSIINNQNLINNKESEENNDNNDDKNELNKINNETDKKIENKSYLNKNEYEEKQFIDYLRKAMKHESIIENMKIELSLRCDFNWEKVFRLLELEGRGFLTKEDIKIGLNKFNIFPKDLEISLLLKRYDLKNEGFLSYPDFFELIVPFSKYHKMMVENRSINPDVKDINPDEFNSETQKCIKNLFNEIINGEFELNKEKENFSSLKNNFSNIFKLIDTTDIGYIGEKDFVVYIQKNNLFKSGNECDLLFLRFNKLRNGRIEYQEMLNEIEPIH